MMRVVIVGGGIVGVSTAYYLAKLKSDDIEITIVEANEIAGSASGKAGGFLARDWHGRGAEAEIARRSFELHEKLAEELDDIGYRRCEALQVTCPGSKSAMMTTWYDSVGSTSVIAPRDSAAQVVPYKLVRALVERSKANVRIGTVTNVDKKTTRDKIQITFTTSKGNAEKIDADAVLFACGPWTSTVLKSCNIKFSTQVLGQKATSILLQPNSTMKKKMPDSMLFLDWRGDPRAGELEVYPRLDGIYVCGCGESPCVVKEHPRDVKSTETASKILRDCASIVSPKHLKDAKVLRSTACYLPVTSRGIVAGRVDKNIYVATGHSCWGILNGPATGSGMAEIIASDLFQDKKMLGKCGNLLLKSFSV
jgi:glycine/D-amino acid oxidase-like deaminating enzyme